MLGRIDAIPGARHSALQSLSQNKTSFTGTPVNRKMTFEYESEPTVLCFPEKVPNARDEVLEGATIYLKKKRPNVVVYRVP